MKPIEVINIIVKIIIIISAIIIIYWGIQLIIGGSPDLSQFNAALIVMIIGVLFTLTQILSKLNKEIGEIKTGLKHSFKKIKEDMTLIKRKLRITI